MGVLDMNKQQKHALDVLRKKMDEAGVSSLDALLNTASKEEIARSAANT